MMRTAAFSSALIFGGLRWLLRRFGVLFGIGAIGEQARRGLAEHTIVTNARRRHSATFNRSNAFTQVPVYPPRATGPRLALRTLPGCPRGGGYLRARSA